jgi:Na+:H+ antiporter, NhaA family
VSEPPATAERPPSKLPAAPIDRLVGPVQAFLHVEAAGGVVLLAFTVTALVLANSPWADGFLAIWKTEVGLRWGGLEMQHPLKHWINDALMALFFFVVGLEVKRELVLGELRDPRRAALPFAAAIGGMVVPAAIYLALLAGSPHARGWGIPMATDIAFAVGCLAVLGSRVPASLRVLLLSLAIVDDIGAILVIAIGYTSHVAVGFLGLGALAIAAVAVLQRLGVRSVGVYAVLGVGIWLCFHESGVHATIAGVILGLLTPAQGWVSGGRLAGIVRRAERVLAGAWEERGVRYQELRRIETAAREALSPLERLEKVLHPWVSFGIMPLFAFANAGVPIELGSFGEGVALAVAAGLVIGKPAGVLAFSWLAVRAGLASLPEGAGWRAVAAVGVLAGVGFTMSLFIGGLALQGAALDAAKVGILAGSVVSGALGVALLLVALPRRAVA